VALRKTGADAHLIHTDKGVGKKNLAKEGVIILLMGKLVLNDEQREAVEHKGEPLLIIAGAGTGKTTVITERVKYLVKNELALPSEILALTFTEKAAREMEERVDRALPYGYTQTWISTFHSFCDRILRNEALHIGLNSAYRLIGQAESIQLLQNNLWDLDLSYFRPRGNPTKFVTGLLNHFNRLKDEDVLPSQYADWVNSKFQIPNSKNIPEEIEKWKELSRVYRQYEELKIKEGLMDFADLISNTLELFRRRKNILREYQKRFKYILVDEFQDTNIAQYELVKLLAPNDSIAHLAVVGDDSQSIYKFRGAAVSNILSFMKDYPNAKQVVLIKNYRSTQKILNHSYKLIKHNDPDTLEAKLGIDKNLLAVRKNAKQAPIKVIYTERVEEEADIVVKRIKEEKEKGLHWKDFAILVRANNHAEPFVQALKRNGVPFQFLGPGQLFRQDEVRDLIAYIKTLAHFDDSTSFYRVLAMDIWGISGRDLAALNIAVRRSNLSLFEVSEEVVKQTGNIQLPRLSEKTIKTLTTIVNMIHRHLELVPKETAGQILFYFLEDSRLLPLFVSEPESAKQEQKIANIARFFDKLKSYETQHEDASVGAVADWIDLSLELGESPLASDLDWTQEDRVNILTVHSSKGLEFPVVFLVNLVNLRFPSINRREQIPIPQDLIQETLPEGDFHEQEERRLFYVGMTRAKNRLFFTASKYYGEGKRERKISGFVKEAIGKSNLSSQLTQKQKIQLELFDAWKKKDETIQTPSTLKHKPTFLSYSQINTFKMCPLHYKLRYILKVPTPTSPALILGQSVHDALKDFYKYLMRDGSWSKQKLLDYLLKNWNSVGFGSRKQEKASLKVAKEYLSNFFDKEKNREFNTKAVEEMFRFPVTSTLLVGGRIDRIDLLQDGRIEIIDYKTSDKVPEQKKVDKELQLTIYALAASEVRHPFLLKQPDEILLSLYYFSEQKKITTTRTLKQLIETKEEIIDIARQIEESDFACSGSNWCKKCEYRLYCNTV
jgi:DNA helicase-2/ATP-dependent DNA helicase PcrA